MISDKNRKILRYVLFGLVMLSVVLGIKAMYIDLYNPGSTDARELNSIMNYIFVTTMVCSIPLLIEKVKKFQAWETEYSNADYDTQKAMLWVTAKPILKKVGVALLLTVIVSIVLVVWWHPSPEIVANYKEFYSPKVVTFP